MDEEPIFIKVWNGKVGLNIRDIKRWKWEDTGHLDVTVSDGRDESTYMVHGEEAQRAHEILLKRSA
jgi:hypothetical protein